MPVPELAEEIAYFEQHRDELLKRAPGKFALIKGSAFIDTFDNAENAYKEGSRLFPGQPFLIQEILPKDRIQQIPAYYSGAMYAAV